MENERGSWGSNFGFLMAAIGSAVGLGNIWGFPYKMGKSGGFTFLIVYLLLALFVGFTIMMAEFALGRKTGTGPIGAYHAVSSRFKWIGWLAVFSPFIIMSFYSVLGGYCMEYMALNLSNLAFQNPVIAGSDLFGAMLTNPWGALIYTVLFLVICYLINRGGISGGIEKFNNVGMPALFVMLVIIIIKSLSMALHPQARQKRRQLIVKVFGYAAGIAQIQLIDGPDNAFRQAGSQKRRQEQRRGDHQQDRLHRLQCQYPDGVPGAGCPNHGAVVQPDGAVDSSLSQGVRPADGGALAQSHGCDTI